MGVFLFLLRADGYADWAVTNYPSKTGNMAIIYSVVNLDTGELALIDGGYVEDGPQVKELMDQYGTVNTWILTHFHEDHCGAFNALWSNQKDRVGRVFVSAIDPQLLLKNAQSWDKTGYLSTYLKKTSGDKKITSLHAGTEMNVVGLKMNVFLAGDDPVVFENLESIWNNCSVVFKLSGSRDAVLFLGDLQDETIGNYLVEKYGAGKLHAEYVQAAHHGHWGSSTRFYEVVKPEFMFFDAPAWLMNGTQFTAGKLKKWCEKRGIKTTDYRAGATTIIIRSSDRYDLSDIAEITGLRDMKYNGSERKTGFKLRYKKNLYNLQKTLGELKEGRDYTVSYSNYVDVGTAVVTVSGINRFSGTLRGEYQITMGRKPASVKTKVRKNKVTVTWKAPKKKLRNLVKSVQVQYATDPEFREDVLTKQVGKKKTSTILKLPKGKKYFIRVRFAFEAGYSKWSKVKKVRR